MENFKDFFPSTRLFLVSIFFIFVISYLFKWWQENKRLFALAAKLEHPQGFSHYPIIGHGHHFLNRRSHEALIRIVKSFKTSLGAAYLGSRVIFFINEAELVEKYFNNDKCLDKADFLDLVVFEDGLVMARGDQWKKHRKILVPAFNQRILNAYAKHFSKHDEILVQQLHEKVGQVFDMGPISKQCSFGKFFDSALGIEGAGRGKEYFDAFETSSRLLLEKIFNCFYHVDVIFALSYLRIRIKAAEAVLKRICQEVLKERAEKRAELNNTMAEVDDLKDFIFLDMMVDSAEDGKVLSNDEVLAEINTFIAAGVETCSLTISFMCICLAKYPEIQEKVYREIMEVIGPHRPFQQSDMPNLKYLQNVVKETMRLFPPVPTTPRSPSEDIQLGDHVFPANSYILVNIINLHYSEKYYKDPKKFDPDRFNPEEVQKRHKYAYIPFASGKRYCMGERFAIMSIMSTAAYIFKEFRFETTYEDLGSIKLEHLITLNPVDGFLVKVFPRMK